MRVARDFENAGSVFVAAAGIPDRAGKIQLPQMRQAFEFSKLDRMHHARRQVDRRNVNFTGRNLADVRKGLGAPFERNLSLPAQGPFGDLAFRSALRGSRGEGMCKGGGCRMPMKFQRITGLLYYSVCGEVSLTLKAARENRFRSILAQNVRADRFRGRCGARRTSASKPDSIRFSKKRDAALAITRMASPRRRACTSRRADAPPATIEAFGRSLVVLVDREHPDSSLLLNKPTNRMPHAGGERIKPGSAEEAVLKTWIARLTRLSGDELAAALHFRERRTAARTLASRQPGAPPADAQPVQPHGARSAGRSDRSRQSVSARRFHQWVSQSIARAESFAAAD